VYVDKGERITGLARVRLRRHLAAQYETGSSIRALAAVSGRSYSSVHRLLSEAKVTMRGRGGSRSKRR
jgi:predicted transcriptional regulator